VLSYPCGCYNIIDEDNDKLFELDKLDKLDGFTVDLLLLLLLLLFLRSGLIIIFSNILS
jgi:hypothetical protein